MISPVKYIALAVADSVEGMRSRLTSALGLVVQDPDGSSCANQELKAENDRLRRQLKRLSDFIDTSSDVVWETDDHLAIVSSNGDLQIPGKYIGPRLAQATGVNPLLSKSWMEHLNVLANRQSFREFEISIPQIDGQVAWLELNGNPTFAKGKFLGYRGTYRDVTQRKLHEAQIAYMANHDPLTKLANRARFRQLVDQALSSAQHRSNVVILYLDLDGFKGVNDTFGHAIGDLLLLAVAERLLACAGHADVVSRLGGDEFAILQTDSAASEAACSFAEKLLAAVSEPYLLDDHRIVIGTSIGISIAPTLEATAESFIKDADVALYRSKADGRGTYRLFESDMNKQLHERRTLETDLRGALERHEFKLVYQPIVKIESKQVVAFEALLRWHHPKKGVIPPASFISLAEETGLIVPIGEWVLRQACQEAASWPSNIKVAVNLSPVQFKRGNLEMAVTRALAAAALHGSRLELEITEGILLQDEEGTRAILNQLRILGVQIAIDDFGIGYSALSYLRNFPLDKIKIDQSFVKNFSEGPKAAAIVRAIAELGNALDMTIVAEGVETADQLAILQNQRCAEAQGYFIARPQSSQDVPRLLERLGMAAPSANLAISP